MLENARTELYRLIDALPDSDMPIARRFLEFLLVMGDAPLLTAFLTAPEDDEALDAQDLEDLAEAQRAIAEGRVKDWQEVKKDLGL
jgi:hypothetical protein